MERHFTKDIRQKYAQLPVYIQKKYPTIVAAVNAGYLNPTNMYNDVEVYVKTGIPKFERFKINPSKDWHPKLTRCIAGKLGKNNVDVVYKGTPIITLPLTQLINLSRSKERFDVVECDVVADMHPQELIVARDVAATSTSSVKETPKMLVEKLKQDFVNYVKKQPSSQENMISVVTLMNNQQITHDMVNDWIASAIEVPGETSKVIENILSVIDPSPAVTPVINALVKSITDAATTTTNRIAGSPPVDTVVNAFNAAFDPTPLVNVMGRVLGVDASINVNSNINPSRHYRNRRGSKHLRTDTKGWVHDPERHTFSIGDAYAANIRSQKAAVSIDIGHRIFATNLEGNGKKLVARNTKLSAYQHICIELDPMKSKESRILSAIKNAVQGVENGVLFGLFAVNARGRTEYSRCFYLGVDRRETDSPKYTEWIDLPYISNHSKYRVVIWQQRAYLGGRGSWGEILGKLGDIPPPYETIDIKNINDQHGATYENHPYIDAEHGLLIYLDKMSYQDVAIKAHELLIIYQMQVNPPDNANANQQPQASKIEQRVFSDIPMSVGDALLAIKCICEQNVGKITDSQRLYLTRVVSMILVEPSETPLPIYTGSKHDGIGRTRTATEFKQRGLNTFGTDFFGIDKDGIHIFGRRNIPKAFFLFLTNPEASIVAAIRLVYPMFRVDEDFVPAIADYTGDYLPVDTDEVNTESPMDTVLDGVVEGSAAFGSIVVAGSNMLKQGVANAEKTAESGLGGLGGAIVDTAVSAVETTAGVLSGVFSAIQQPAESVRAAGKELLSTSATATASPSGASVQMGPASLSVNTDPSPDESDIRSKHSNRAHHTYNSTTAKALGAHPTMPNIPPQSARIGESISFSSSPSSSSQPDISSRHTGRSVVSKVVKRDHANTTSAKALGLDRSHPNVPVPAKRIGDDIKGILLKSRTTVVAFDFAHEYRNILSKIPQSKLHNFRKVVQVGLTYKPILQFCTTNCQYEVIDDLQKDDPDLLFVPNSHKHLGYKPSVIFAIIRGNETMSKHFWSRVVSKPFLFEDACVKAAGKALPLISMDTVILHIAGHDTDFHVPLPEVKIEQSIAHVALHLPGGDIRKIAVPSPTTTLRDINTISGNNYDEFSVVVEGKHHNKHGKTYYCDSPNGDLTVESIFKSLPEQYQSSRTLVLKPGQHPPLPAMSSAPVSRQKGMNTFLTAIGPGYKDMKIKKPLVFVAPTDQEIEQYKASLNGSPITAGDFAAQYIHPVSKRHGVRKLKHFKGGNNSISGDPPTITVEGKEFKLKKYSGHSKIYIIDY